MTHLIPQLFASDEPGRWPAAPTTPSASTSRFLAMIPSGLPSLLAASPLPGHQAALKAPGIAATLLSRINRDEASSQTAEEEDPVMRAFEKILPAPLVILKRQSVVEQAEAITQAALDCGRIHTDRAEQLYRLLATAALAHHFQLRPDAKVTPNRLAFFLVVDELPELLDLGRATVYRAFADLKWSGLVDHRAWRTSSAMAGGKTVAGGVVVEVILTPRQGIQARVRAEYLRQHYRNLDADRFAGRTAWQWKTEFKEQQTLAGQLEEQADLLPPHE